MFYCESVHARIVCVCVCVCVCVRACLRACVRARARACVRIQRFVCGEEHARRTGWKEGRRKGSEDTKHASRVSIQGGRLDERNRIDPPYVTHGSQMVLPSPVVLFLCQRENDN